MEKTLRYTLEIRGEYHSGTGLGLPGIVDEFVLRDSNGAAYFPASHIKGILRDSCFRLLGYRKKIEDLCAGQIKWQALNTDQIPDASEFCGLARAHSPCLLCTLFGSPSVPGSAWFSPATYPHAETLASLDLAESDGTLRAYTSIDPVTKRAKTNQLFQIEVVQPEDRFEGEVRLPAAVENADELLTWLGAAILLTRRIGGRRRRGLGHCRFHLDPAAGDNQAALEQIENW